MLFFWEYCGPNGRYIPSPNLLTADYSQSLEQFLIYDMNEPLIDIHCGHPLVVCAPLVTLNVPELAARLRVERLESLHVAGVQFRIDILPGLATLPVAGLFVLMLLLRPVRGQRHIDVAVYGNGKPKVTCSLRAKTYPQ